MWDSLATTFYDGSDAAQVFDLNRRVTRLRQSGKSVEEYYNDLQRLWQEIDFCRPNPMVHEEDIKKFNSFIQETRVYTFLDGLDDSWIMREQIFCNSHRFLQLNKPSQE